MFPLIASFAAMQDWDGLFQFDWGGTTPDSRRIAGFFSLQQHPAKLAFLPAAALMFRRGDVEAARATAQLAIPISQVEALTADDVSMSDAWKQAGVAAGDHLGHRLELRFTQKGKLEATMAKAAPSSIAWDAPSRLYTVDAPAAKAVVGRCDGKTTRLDGAEFAVETNLNHFAALTLNALDGRPLARSRRLLLAAAGDVENTGMGWNADRTSVGARWGEAPTICEGIAARITFATETTSAKVYALDGGGTRAAELPVSLTGGRLSFDIAPRYQTLWYEIVMK